MRLLITDNSPAAVKKSLANLKPGEDYIGLSNAAEARSVSDQLYGFNLTRLYTLAARQRGYGGIVLSVGRVKTPLLNLIVQRDKIHETHEKSFYYPVVGEFAFRDFVFKANYLPKDNDPIDDKNRIIDKSFSENLALQCNNQLVSVESVLSEEKTQPAPLPYNLLNLQADCARKFNLKPDEVLSITQALRENHHLITYNRSDCEYLSTDQYQEAPSILSAVGDNIPVLSKAVSHCHSDFKSRAFNDAKITSHTAIIPTETRADISKLTDSEQKVYMLIARALIAQFFPLRDYQTTAVKVVCENNEFAVNTSVTIKPGWQTLYKNDKDNEEVTTIDSDRDLSVLAEGSQGVCNRCEAQEKETKPLPRYNFSSLLKDITRVAKYVKSEKIKSWLLEKDKGKAGEHGGIGTPATRSEILKDLISRGFVEEKGKQLISTKTGRDFIAALPDICTSPDMTAYWHHKQKDIEAGHLSVVDFVNDVVKFISDEVKHIKKEGLSIEQKGDSCPECKEGVLERRKGSHGFFWSCCRYPECKTSFSDKKGKPDYQKKEKKEIEVSKEFTCEKCGKGLIRRQSKKGKKYWWGCSGFPECKQTYFESSVGFPDFIKKVV